MASEDTSGLGCMLTLVALTGGQMAAYWLCGHYEVTDPVTTVLVHAGMAMFGTGAMLFLLAMVLFAAGFVLIPLGWAVDWMTRPTWRDVP